MPVYAYKGYNQTGRVVADTRDAESQRTLKLALRRDGIFVTEVKEVGGKLEKESGGRRIRFEFLENLGKSVSPQELAVATRQMATLARAGIPLVESLTALIDQVDNEYFRTVWADVKTRVNEGAGIGDALSAHPKVFSGLYVNLVRAGESSGALDIVLERLADFTEAQAQLRGKLIGAMVYPILMMMMAIGVTTFIFVVVVPRITKIFDSQGVELPLPTQILIGVSTFVLDYGYIFGPLFVIGAIFAVRFFRSEKGRPIWDRFILEVPIFGPLMRMVAVTRFSKTLSTLLASGVPLLTAFDIVKNVVQNVVLADVIEVARDAVKEGDSIAAPLKRSSQFPPIVTHMIAIGEKSGELEGMLSNIAQAYDVEVDARLRALTTILEPVMIVFMGIVVGFIVFSVLLPMLQLASFAG
ncbi:MAG: type II secretion system inner membrane protein GspF [Myxococcota bacterium]